MPFHVRAEPGHYAEACLLPGDPLRARYIADTYLDDAVQRNSERGMLGYTGTFEGAPVSVQATGMGCPSAAIVMEELVQPVRVGAIASSDTFYDPDPGRHRRWSERGVLGVEMEAAVLFTIGSLRGVQAGCLLTVSDIVIGEEFTRISDDELRAAVDRMTRVALDTDTAGH